MFLLKDLAPLSQKQEYIPVYASLWQNTNAPHEPVLTAIEETLAIIGKQGTISRLLKSKITKTTIGNELLGKMEIEFASDPQRVSSDILTQFDKSLSKLEKAGRKKTILLLIDEIQHLATSSAFEPFTYALRTALDKRQGRIKAVFTGSSRHYMSLLFNQNSAPFYHFVESVPFPDLEIEFAEYLSDKLATEHSINISVQKLWKVFQELDQSPYWMLKVVNHLITSSSSLNVAHAMVHELLCMAEGLEERAKQLKPIDKIVFLAIADNESPFSQVVMDRITQNTRYKGVSSNIQKAIARLKAQNLISQLDKGQYHVEKPGLKNYLQEMGEIRHKS